MRKQILPYIFSVACILSACSTYFNEPDPGEPDENEMLSLNVTASQSVDYDGISSRAINDDTVSYTEFEVGDSIGVIVMDAAGRILADNVPFRYNGKDWIFNADKDGEGKRPYYDATMSKYIVYFPYTPTANGSTSVDGLKSLEVFAHKDNQNLKKDYLSSDIMVWTYEGDPIKRIEAALTHEHNTFSLAQPNIKWDIVPTGEQIEYTAKDETLSDLIIKYTPENGDPIIIKNNEIDLTYRATDRSYRYLLPNDWNGYITWQYTYRGITFHGKRKIPADANGTRFSSSHTAYMGELPGAQMQFSDFYCSTADGTGYVLPWDAEELLPGRHCIGLVVYVGQHKEDLTDYSDSNIQRPRCQGYAISLTDAYDEPLLEIKNNINTLPWWTVEGSNKVYVGTLRIDNNIRDWSGYYNQQQIKKYAEENFGNDLSRFPAAFVCEYYGNKIIKNDNGEIEVLSNIHTGLEPPHNTTGWFLPTGHMMFDLKKLDNILIGRTLYVTAGSVLAIDKVFLDRREAIKEYAVESDLLYDEKNFNYLDGDITLYNKKYWGSNECYNTRYDGYIICSDLCQYRRQDSVYRDYFTTSYYIKARPVLAF